MCVLFGLFFNIFCLVYVCLFCRMSHSGRPVWKWARTIVADNGLCGWQVLFRVVVIRDSSFVRLIQSRKRFLFRLTESLFFLSTGGFFLFWLPHMSCSVCLLLLCSKIGSPLSWYEFNFVWQTARFVLDYVREKLLSMNCHRDEKCLRSR